jgi:ABC-type transport system substrate-binding protein
MTHIAPHWTVRALAPVVGIGLIAAALGGCSSGTEGTADAQGGPAPVAAADEAPQRGGHLVYGLEADPNGLDPTRNALDRPGVMLANALYDPIAAFDSSGNVRPYLVERFETNADYTEWRFHIRPGILFHSGAKLDAEALLTYAQALRDSPVTGPVARYVKDLVKLDELTGIVVMNKPWSTFPLILTGQGGYVVSPKQLKDPEGQIHPDGTGPFKLVKWDLQKHFELVRNPSYWRPELPYLDALDFEIIPDGPQRLARLRSGDLDVISANHWDEIQALNALVDQQRSTKDDRIRLERDLGAADASFVLLNSAKPPLDDVRVRRAIAHATDRAALARANGWPAEDLLDGVFHRDSPWYTPTDVPPFDLDKARQLLREYQVDQRRKGRDGKVAFTILGSYDMPALQQLVEQWAKAGITASIEQIGFTQHIVRAVIGQYDAELLRYLGAIDPDSLWHFFSSDTYAPPGQISLNITRMRDAQLDRAIDAGRATLDPAKRKQAYDEMQRRLTDLSTMIFLVRSSWYIATSSRVRDIHNVKLPDGRAALPYVMGTHRLTETWISR